MKNIPAFDADYTPLYLADMECAVIGSCMLEKQALARVIEILRPEYFYQEQNRIMFEALVSMFTRGINADILTVAAELRSMGTLEAIGGVFAVSEYLAKTPTAANVEQYAHIVKEYYLRRELVTASAKIHKAASDLSLDSLEACEVAQNLVSDVTATLTENTFRTAKQAAKDVFAEIAAAINSKHQAGINTGFFSLDAVLGGLKRGDFVVLGARPSQGKSALAAQIAVNIASFERVPVAYFSLEMTTVQLMARLVSSATEINAQRILGGKMSEFEQKECLQAVSRLSEMPIFFDDTSYIGLTELRAKCLQMTTKAEAQWKEGLRVVIVDYLQLMKAEGSKNETRDEKVGKISRGLKALAKDYGITVIALAQLNRQIEQRSDRTPLLSDLRESGAIEADADTIMFLHRPEFYNTPTIDITDNNGLPESIPSAGKAVITVGKNRNGVAGKNIILNFIGEYVRFEEQYNSIPTAPPQ